MSLQIGESLLDWASLNDALRIREPNMARKSTKPQHVEPEEESQGSPDDEGARRYRSSEPGGEGRRTITKADAIRRALAEGLTKHEDAAPFIRSQFGHDCRPGHFAASKSREKPAGEPARKPGRPKGATVKVKAKRGPKPKAASQAFEGYLAPPSAPRNEGGEADLLGRRWRRSSLWLPDLAPTRSSALKTCSAEPRSSPIPGFGLALRNGICPNVPSSTPGNGRAVP